MARGATTDLTTRHLSGVWHVRSIHTHTKWRVASKVIYICVVGISISMVLVSVGLLHSPNNNNKNKYSYTTRNVKSKLATRELKMFNFNYRIPVIQFK